jgi:hypothetical protein
MAQSRSAPSPTTGTSLSNLPAFGLPALGHRVDRPDHGVHEPDIRLDRVAIGVTDARWSGSPEHHVEL